MVNTLFLSEQAEDAGLVNWKTGLVLRVSMDHQI